MHFFPATLIFINMVDLLTFHVSSTTSLLRGLLYTYLTIAYFLSNRDLVKKNSFSTFRGFHEIAIFQRYYQWAEFHHMFYVRMEIENDIYVPSQYSRAFLWCEQKMKYIFNQYNQVTFTFISVFRKTNLYSDHEWKIQKIHGILMT